MKVGRVFVPEPLQLEIAVQGVSFAASWLSTMLREQESKFAAVHCVLVSGYYFTSRIRACVKGVTWSRVEKASENLTVMKVA